MITRVQIENFQSHKKAELEFVPGTNVIIGKSDAGKSAIFRAINWVISNRPLGDAFCSEWGGETKVTLYTSEGDVVERVRTPSRNEYIINGVTLKAFGMEVPEEVTQVLRMDIHNVQAQMDPFFLLGATPGEASRLLNKAASLEDIDIVTSKLKSAVSSINNEITHLTKELTKSKEALMEYDNLPDIERLLHAIEKEQETKDALGKGTENLRKITERGKSLETQLAKMQDIPFLIENYEGASTVFLNFTEKEQKHKALQKIFLRGQKIKEQLKRTSGITKLLQNVEEAEKGLKAIKEKTTEHSQLNSICTRVQWLYSELDKRDKAIIYLEKEYAEMAPETCPLCGSIMGVQK